MTGATYAAAVLRYNDGGLDSGQMMTDWFVPGAGSASAGVGPAAFLRRLAHHRRGAVAVEFALVGPLFLLLLLAIVELAIALLTQAELDFATQAAARTIEIGTSTTQAAFSKVLCNDAAPLIPCASLQIRVTAASTFGLLNSTLQYNASGNITNTGFSAGSQGQAVLVQVGYNQPYIVGLVGKYFGLHSSSLLLSTVAFMNENY